MLNNDQETAVVLFAFAGSDARETHVESAVAGALGRVNHSTETISHEAFKRIVRKVNRLIEVLNS